MKHKHELSKAVDIVQHYGGMIHEGMSGKASVLMNIETKHGTVNVSVMPAWVHIRLPEPLIPLASEAFWDKPNPFSGKWNIHTDTPEHEELERRLGWIKDNA